MIARATDLRVEILAGSLVLSRTDCRTRAAVARDLADRIAQHATVVEAPSVRIPMDPDDFAVPDLAVLVDGVETRERTIRTQDIALAVEIVPRQEKSREFGRKSDWYAVAHVRALLVVDPRHGTWALHTAPDGARYRRTRPGTYGEAVPLPEPSALDLVTGALAVYGEAGGSV
ncbi:Uma2 family endonuclease [Streptomyces sp. NPDC048389]|uniref:Uma2 family endonuclease n=1 Tax=Streptomyces sp. NPDC048389 TaxID=3154622 RepID=UPI00345519FF